MTDSVRFLLGDRIEAVAAPDPTTTVLQWLRRNGRIGTKEGCAEGDCGACTVVLGEAVGSRVRYRAVNACILFLPMLDGRQLLTVEDLEGPDSQLHPVQQALVDAHASQCGFCTPGFAMSLFALFQDAATGGPADDEAIRDALAGNLCRCTGYRPIVDAARRISGGGTDRFAQRAGDVAAQLAAIGRGRGLSYRTAEGRSWHAPRSLDELARLAAVHPDAWIVAGATDVGLWVTKQHRRADVLIWLGEVAELRDVAERDGWLEIGSAVSYRQALPAIAARWPGFGALLGRLGSTQIRNSGTIGGNVANASPIGDTMPALIALGARVVLNAGGTTRELALEDFFLGYRRTALAAGEILERVRVPLAGPTHFAAYKVSKRRDQDISAVAAGFALRLDGGIVIEARLAFGGMAAVPARAPDAERALVGRPWTADAARAAAAALDRDFRPLSDMRASAAYRMLVARNLLTRFLLETTGRGESLEALAHA
jgi:xanthine dehydrogenase small subunit